MKEAATTTLVMLALAFCTQSLFQSAYASASSSAAVAAAAATARRTTTSSSDSPDGLTCGQTRVLYNDNACCSSNLGAKTCTRSVAKGQWDQIGSNLTEKLAAVSNAVNQRLVANDASHLNWTTTKLKGYVASTAAQFRRVELKFDENRVEVDNAQKSLASRIEAKQNALKAFCDQGIHTAHLNASAEVQAHVEKYRNVNIHGVIATGLNHSRFEKICTDARARVASCTNTASILQGMVLKATEDTARANEKIAKMMVKIKKLEQPPAAGSG